MRKINHGLIHCIAHCSDCDWMEEAFMIAARKATQHHKQTGHTVHVEQGHHYKITK